MVVHFGWIGVASLYRVVLILQVLLVLYTLIVIETYRIHSDAQADHGDDRGKKVESPPNVVQGILDAHEAGGVLIQLL